MTIKRVKTADLFATGDACVFSMAGEPEYMYKGLTPSKHYVGYIKHVDNMHHEYTIVVTNDEGKPCTLTHYADPLREPIGMPLYYLLEVLLDKETYLSRLRKRLKKINQYEQKRHEKCLEANKVNYEKAITDWTSLKDR